LFLEINENIKLSNIYTYTKISEFNSEDCVINGLSFQKELPYSKIKGRNVKRKIIAEIAKYKIIDFNFAFPSITKDM